MLGCIYKAWTHSFFAKEAVNMSIPIFGRTSVDAYLLESKILRLEVRGTKQRHFSVIWSTQKMNTNDLRVILVIFGNVYLLSYGDIINLVI